MAFNLDDYEPVQARIGRFWDDHKALGFVTTEIVSTPADGTSWVVKATVGDGIVLATGYAEEIPGQGNVNKTSALENCETSAIGRALANAGYTPSVSARASREELAAVDQQRNDMDDTLDTAKALAATLDPDADEHWKAWKQEHDGWHKTLPGMQDAVVELRRIIDHYKSVGGVEPVPLPASDEQHENLFDEPVVPPPTTSNPATRVRKQLSTKIVENSVVADDSSSSSTANSPSTGESAAHGNASTGKPSGSSGAVRRNKSDGLRPDGKKKT